MVYNFARHRNLNWQNTWTSQILYPDLCVLLCRTYGWVQLLAIARERAQSTKTEPVVFVVNAALESQRSFVHVQNNTDDIWRLKTRHDTIRVLVDDTVTEQTFVGDNVPAQGLVVATQQRGVT